MNAKKLISFILLILLLPVFLPDVQAAPLVTEEAKSRRAGIFSVSADDFGFVPSEEHPHIWSVVMETAPPETLITFTAALGGNANIYFGSGGKITGAGTDPGVMAVNDELFAEAERARKNFRPAPRGILYPYAGEVKFYLFTFESGILAAEADERVLQDGGHPLSPLYLAAQDVISEIRKVVES